VLYGIDDIIKYYYFKHIVLDDSVPNQIHPKAIPEKGKSLSIR